MYSMIGQHRSIITASLISTSLIYLAWKWYSKRDQPPTKWRKVGILSDMMCFPIKSCGVIKLSSMECDQIGLNYNLLRDRNFCIVNDLGIAITARVHPKMLLIKPSISGNELQLTAPGMDPIILNLETVPQEPLVKIKLWDQPVSSTDCGDDIGKWLSKFILNTDTGLKLVYFPTHCKMTKRSRLLEIVSNIHSGAYPDLTSYNLINSSSVDDLNTKIKDMTIDPQRFRPNFVVEGALPYEEDYWNWVKIGDVTFRVVKYCTRCLLTTIDWKTGIKNDKMEPLATLKTYRMIGKKWYDKNSPIMGIHLILENPGSVKLGDDVFVG